MRSDNRFPSFLIPGICLSLILLNLIPLLFPVAASGRVQGISSEMYLSLTEERKSSFDLKAIDDGYQLFTAERLSSSSNFAYLWIEISNSDQTDREIVLSNRTRNYYTELLFPDAAGAVTLFRQGDIVPLSESPYRHYKSGFPLIVAAESTVSYVLEYHGPRGLALDPEIISSSEWLNRVSGERGLAGFICGIFIFLLVLNSIYGMIFSRKYFYSTVFFITTNFFFFLRQSRILLLIIDPLVYPEWLYPLSIALNLMGAFVFSKALIGEYLQPWKLVMLRGAAGITVLLAAAAFFYAPYEAADLLNILALVSMPVILSCVPAIVRKRDYEVQNILLSFLPWIVIVVMDIVASFLDVRLTLPAEYRQAFGMIASLLMLSITIQHENGQRQRAGYLSVSKALKQARAEIAGQVTSVTELRASVLHQVGYQLRQPLDSILALSSILSNEYAEPRITAVSKVLAAEAGELKRKIEKEVGNPGLIDVSIQQAGGDLVLAKVFDDVPAPRPWISSRICIYDIDARHASRTVFLLRSHGYEVNMVSDQYQILSSITAGKIDVLIIDPTSAGESAFSLCGLIRGDYNLFEVPILMMTNYYADYLMKKGYAAGVNDFLTMPYDASELAARVQSLVKLKQVAKHNHDLARSEKEKNTFLYFLTHNINTPLTLLLNRVNELKEIGDVSELYEITDDLLASSREISDIVQNVLISFRLSDGRQTVRLNEIELEPIVSAVEHDLQKKAEEKNQRLTINLPAEIPAVLGDFTAVRGIIYNLADNGLKFSPSGGEVRIVVSVSDTVVLEVCDTGPGIPASEQDRLFERFERLSPQPTAGESSTGLGLYVAFELARMNGGGLEYCSGSPGACFRLTLPRFFKEIYIDD